VETPRVQRTRSHSRGTTAQAFSACLGRVRTCHAQVSHATNFFCSCLVRYYNYGMPHFLSTLVHTSLTYFLAKVCQKCGFNFARQFFFVTATICRRFCMTICSTIKQARMQSVTFSTSTFNAPEHSAKNTTVVYMCTNHPNYFSLAAVLSHTLHHTARLAGCLLLQLQRCFSNPTFSPSKEQSADFRSFHTEKP
jgi:protein-S-isoprenylcysteine O-methyltransferase Ste14